MKLALVHDWLKDIGGAERVLIELHRMFPHAPIYALFYDKKFVREHLSQAKIHASFLQKIPFITKIYPAFGWLMPVAIESFDLSEFDTVLSSSVTFSKGLVLKPSTRHICYCYSPTRYLWDWHAEYRKTSWPSKIFRHLLRLWDRAAADRVDQFVAISKTVQDRIQKYYRRDSIVIYPPVRKLVDGGHNGPSERNFYLIVSRLYTHKNIDIAIEAFNKLKLPLVIIGDGPLRGSLKRMAGKNITFLGTVDDGTLAAYYNASRALIMPQEEDFGLSPLEAMSFGKPVIALRRGGAMETIIEGETGEFFNDPIPEALADAVRKLNDRYDSYQPDIIKARARLFSVDEFEKNISSLLNT